jgi:hypothetical protein
MMLLPRYDVIIWYHVLHMYDGFIYIGILFYLGMKFLPRYDVFTWV